MRQPCLEGTANRLVACRNPSSTTWVKRVNSSRQGSIAGSRVSGCLRWVSRRLEALRNQAHEPATSSLASDIAYQIGVARV
jgi:hypothetical protein